MAQGLSRWYITTPEGERQMLAALSDPTNGASNLADIKQILAELEQIPDDRCHVSRDQKRFIKRVLSDGGYA